MSQDPIVGAFGCLVQIVKGEGSPDPVKTLIDLADRLTDLDPEGTPKE